MNDRPTAAELIAAARTYLEQDLIPSLTDARQRFQTLVAANVLAIAERELQSEEDQLTNEWARLGELLQLGASQFQAISVLRQGVRERNVLLCERIRSGGFDEPSCFRKLCQQLRFTIERKLEVANPKYLASLRSESAARS
jgi:hypothetical protein